MRTAAKEKDESLQQRLAQQGLAYPPRAPLLRGFKKEGILELWAENTPGRA